MKVNTYPIIRTFGSYILPDSIMKRPGSGGSFSSEYCYSVWLRHLVHLFDSKLISDLSKVKKVAEIGPGDSLGIDLSALLSGAEEYYGFDVIEHSNVQGNLKILKDLVAFFEEEKEIPHEGSRFKNTKPFLADYTFPGHIVKNGSKKMPQDRVLEIERALQGKSEGVKIEYVVPWYEQEIDLKGEIDLIYSQAVMEHVIEIEHAYQKMYEWLKKGGVISHQIDYKAHEISNEWNGHWYIGDGMWKFLMKGRKYPINRLPHSAHINAIKNAGFEIKNVVPVRQENVFGDKPLKVSICDFSEDDMTISSALIQAVKV